MENTDSIAAAPVQARLGGYRYCTEDLPQEERLPSLQEFISREWARVEIRLPARDGIYNDIHLYPWRHGMRLSPIRSNSIILNRMGEPGDSGHDCLNLVLLTRGRYRLEQSGRSIDLSPGQMTLYDVSRPHRITIPASFSKVLISIPRALLQFSEIDVDALVATQFPAQQGGGAITANLIRTLLGQMNCLSLEQFMACADLLLDSFIMAAQASPQGSSDLSRHRRLALHRVKVLIQQGLVEPDLSAATIARGAGLSRRYINQLFAAEGTSMMRYAVQQRLELARQRLLGSACRTQSVSTIALSVGFNDLSHFSRCFKQAYGCSPRDYRRQSADITARQSPGSGE